MKILIRRTGAFGDVILATSVVRRLRRENPDAEIAVQTAYPGVFANSLHRLVLLQSGPLPEPWKSVASGSPDRKKFGDMFVDLDLAYEREPARHIAESYMRAAFGDPGDPFDRQQELFFRPPQAFPEGRKVVAVHAAKAGWRNRTLPEATWLHTIDLLREAGLFPLLVGTARDALANARCANFHSSDALAQAAVVSRCACFLGSDSGMLHLAGATQVPIVCAFTCAAPETRLPWRDGALGGGCEAVLPEGLDCLSCLQRQPAPCVRETCERGDTACVSAVKPERLVEAVLRAVSA